MTFLERYFVEAAKNNQRTGVVVLARKDHIRICCQKHAKSLSSSERISNF